MVTKQETLELRNAESGRVLDRLKIPDFDPCALSVSGWNSVLVANWCQETHNMNQNASVASTLIEVSF